MDSGAAVSLIHLQAYKLMLDTLKTAVILPGELKILTTADGSPMHIIGHATITLAHQAIAIKAMHPPVKPKTGPHFPQTSGMLQKIHQKLC